MKKKKITVYKRLFVLCGDEEKALQRIVEFYQPLIKRAGGCSFIGRVTKAVTHVYNYSIIKEPCLQFQEKAKLSYPIKKNNILWKTGLWVDLYYLDSVGFVQKKIKNAIKLDDLILRTVVTKP
jgi:hypothetical protein